MNIKNALLVSSLIMITAAITLSVNSSLEASQRATQELARKLTPDTELVLDGVFERYEGPYTNKELETNLTFTVWDTRIIGNNVQVYGKIKIEDSTGQCAATEILEYGPNFVTLSFRCEDQGLVGPIKISSLEFRQYANSEIITIYPVALGYK